MSTTRIKIDCLKCGHTNSMPEEALPVFGLPADASLVLVTKKLYCEKCGGKAMQAQRYVDDRAPLVPEG